MSHPPGPPSEQPPGWQPGQPAYPASGGSGWQQQGGPGGPGGQGGPPWGGPPSPWGQQPGPGGLTPDERTWGGAAHWSALVGAFVAMAFLGPLLVLLLKGSSPYVRRQAVESLNFQVSMLVYGLVGVVVGALVTVLTLGLGLLAVVPLALAFGAWWLVFTIIGSVRAASGELYRYPLTLRLVS